MVNPLRWLSSLVGRPALSDEATFASDGGGTAPLAMRATAANGVAIGQPIGYSGSVLDTVAMPPDAEVVSANGTWTGVGAMNMQVLANGVNVKGERLDPTLIEAMLDDPIIAACVNTRKAMILGGEIRFHPSIEEGADDSEDTGDPARGDPEEAKRAAEFCERAHGMLETPIPVWAWDFLDYEIYGHKVAEIVLQEVLEGTDAGLYTLDALKIKGRWAYHLCTDPFLNMVAVYAQTIWGPAYIDKSHFLIGTHAARDADPRGTSILRAAKEPWRRKQRRLRSQTKGDDQFGTPTISVTLPQNAPIESSMKRPDGTPMTTVEATQEIIKLFMNGGSIVVPFGTVVEVIESTRDGSQLVNSINYDDREMVRAILNTNGSGLLEPEHYTQGSGEHAQGKERGIGDVDRDAFLAIVRNLFHYLLEVNWGKGYADLYTPKITLGTMPMDEFLKLATSLGLILQSGGFTKSQWTGLLRLANVPSPKPGELRIGPNGPIPDELPPDPVALAPKTPTKAGEAA